MLFSAQQVQTWFKGIIQRIQYPIGHQWRFIFFLLNVYYQQEDDSKAWYQFNIMLPKQKSIKFPEFVWKRLPQKWFFCETCREANDTPAGNCWHCGQPIESEEQ